MKITDKKEALNLLKQKDFYGNVSFDKVLKNLNQFDESLFKDKKFCLSMVKFDSDLFEFVHTSLRQDKNIIKAAVSKSVQFYSIPLYSSIGKKINQSKIITEILKNIENEYQYIEKNPRYWIDELVYIYTYKKILFTLKYIAKNKIKFTDTFGRIYTNGGTYFIENLKGGIKDTLKLDSKTNFDNINTSSQDFHKILYGAGDDGFKTYALGVNNNGKVKKIFFLAEEIFYGLEKIEDYEILLQRQFFGLNIKDEDSEIYVSVDEKTVRRKKLCNLKISSNYIIIGPSPLEEDIKWIPENDDLMKDYKMLTEPAKQPIKISPDGLENNYLIIPVKNKKYPVYIYEYALYDEEADNLNNKAISIVIENIEGCYVKVNEKGIKYLHYQ